MQITHSGECRWSEFHKLKSAALAENTETAETVTLANGAAALPAGDNRNPPSNPGSTLNRIPTTLIESDRRMNASFGTARMILTHFVRNSSEKLKHPGEVFYTESKNRSSALEHYFSCSVYSNISPGHDIMKIGLN